MEIESKIGSPHFSRTHDSNPFTLSNYTHRLVKSLKDAFEVLKFVLPVCLHNMTDDAYVPVPTMLYLEMYYVEHLDPRCLLEGMRFAWYLFWRRRCLSNFLEATGFVDIVDKTKGMPLEK